MVSMPRSTSDKPTGRPRTLNSAKKRDLLAVLAAGGSRQMASAYVGVSASTIRNEIDRSASFAAAIDRAEEGDPGYAHAAPLAAAWARNRLFGGRRTADGVGSDGSEDGVLERVAACLEICRGISTEQLRHPGLAVAIASTVQQFALKPG
jgi:hypothetical protein